MSGTFAGDCPGMGLGIALKLIYFWNGVGLERRFLSGF